MAYNLKNLCMVQASLQAKKSASQGKASRSRLAWKYHWIHLLLLLNCGSNLDHSSAKSSSQGFDATCKQVTTLERASIYANPKKGAKILYDVEQGVTLQVIGYAIAEKGYKIASPRGPGWISGKRVRCGKTSASTGGNASSASGSAVGGGCRQSYPASWPVPSNRRVGQGYGVPSSYMTCRFHTGIDVSASTGAPVVAAGAGKVVHVGHMWLSSPGTGRGQYSIIIDHGGRTYSTYGHNSSANVRVGECVSAGQKIAGIGSLGYSGGPHLHFEVLKNTPFTGNWSNPFENACNSYVNPMSLLR